MKLQKLFIVLAAAGVLAGCSSEEPVKPYSGKLQEIPVSSDVKLSRNESAVVNQFNSFASDFFNAVAANYDKVSGADNGNIAVSPFSMSIALAMAANAGDEDVKKNIAGVLGYENIGLLNSTCNKLLRLLPSREDCTLGIANSMWHNSRYTPAQDFMNDLNSLYYAEVDNFDASNNAGTAEKINGWIAAKTRNVIKEMMRPENVTDLSRAFFVNALFFESKWECEFSDLNTEDGVFNGTRGKADAKFMHRRFANYSYYGELDDAQYMALGFRSQHAMWLVLPDESCPIEEFSRTFRFEEVYATANRVYANVNIGLPKFEIDCAMRPTEALESMGLVLEGHYPKLGIDENEMLRALQNAKINVDEEGVTMSAGTIIELGASLGIYPPAPIEVDFKLDRPFLFFITDRETNTVLMAGRVCNL